MKNASEKYVRSIEELCRWYDILNGMFFENALSRPVITMQKERSKRRLGYITCSKVWHDQEGEGALEINLTATYMNRPIEEIIGTLLHEMCHQYAIVCGINDTSRSGTYHNRKFRDIAVSHGLVVEKSRYYGFAFTELSPETQERLKRYDEQSTFISRNNGEVFTLPKDESDRPKSSTRKYICPCCGMSVRATKEVNIKCGDCNIRMVNKRERILVQGGMDYEQTF